MKTWLFSLVLAISITMSFSAEPDAAPQSLDVLFLRNGIARAGKLLTMEEDTFRLQVSLDEGKAHAMVTIPKSQVEKIEFAENETMESFFAHAGVADVLTAARYWGAGERYLSYPRSPAARVGLKYAGLLLESKNSTMQERAMELYVQIEKAAWSPEDRGLARQGRLRCLIATGRAAEAVKEAKELAETSENPAVLIEAHYILATVDAKELRKLLAENPRWEENRFVRPQRDLLYNASLDQFLYPYLFFGSETEPAARGLWNALEIYRLAEELPAAYEVALDLTILYPNTLYATRAQEFIATLPYAITNYSHEKDAQETLE